MASSAGALAGADSPGGSPDAGMTSPSTLAGSAAGAGGSPEQQGPDKGMTQVVQQLGQMISTIMDLASQFPAAAKSLGEAEEGLRAANRAIMTSPGSPEPAAPQIGG